MIQGEEFELWLSSRPSAVQVAARRWPVGMRITHFVDEEITETVFVVGWRECPNCGIDIITSPFDPETEPELAAEDDEWIFLDSRKYVYRGGPQ